MSTFNQLFQQYIVASGVIDVLLPFLLVFAIVYAVLEKIKIFGDNKNINIVVAIIFGFFFIAPHLGVIPVSPQQDPVNIIMRASPTVGVLVVAVIALFVLLGLWSKGELDFTKSPAFSSIIVLISFGIVIYLFGQAAGWFGHGWPRWLSFLSNPGVWSTILVLAVVIIAIWFVTGGKKGDQNISKMNVGDFFKNFPKILGGK